MTRTVTPTLLADRPPAPPDGPVDREPATSRRRPTSRWRLGKVGHRVVLIAHVLSSVGWFGIAVAVAFLAIATTATGTAAAPVLRLTLFLTVPVGAAAAVTGVVLSVTTRWGLVRYRWVVLKELVTIVVIVTDLTVVRAGILRGIDEGGPADIIPPSIAHVVVLVLATVLSIAKPFSKTAYGRRRLGDRADAAD